MMRVHDSEGTRACEDVLSECGARSLRCAKKKNAFEAALKHAVMRACMHTPAARTLSGCCLRRQRLRCQTWPGSEWTT
jgi:hypothetical protein